MEDCVVGEIQRLHLPVVHCRINEHLQLVVCSLVGRNRDDVAIHIREAIRNCALQRRHKAISGENSGP